MGDDETLPPEDADRTVPKITDSDPSGSGPHGLAGGMGVSSERTGRVSGTEGEVTHGAADPHQELPTDEDPPPEKSAGGSEVRPTDDLPPHRLDRSRYQGHSHG